MAGLNNNEGGLRNKGLERFIKINLSEEEVQFFERLLNELKTSYISIYSLGDKLEDFINWLKLKGVDFEISYGKIYFRNFKGVIVKKGEHNNSIEFEI